MNTTDKIAKLLERKRTITPLQAFMQFGCLRLAPRIGELRKSGMNIITMRKKLPNGKVVAQYKLADA